MDKYRIDSHKLIYHVDRVAGWQAGRNIYPVYAEFSPSGACNHRCVYCGLDFMGYKPLFHDTAKIKTRIAEMGRLGLKSIMFAGEGEPFLHKDMPEIITHTRKSGIDAALTTNGALFSREKCDACLKDITWIKVSINAGTPETYSKIQGTRAEDFEKVMANMAYAARLKRARNYGCALGMQMVLLPDNAHEAAELARRARDIGMNYLVIKPYSQHPQSKTRKYKDIKYADYERLGEKLEKLNSPSFSVVFRFNTMRKWDSGGKKYSRCLALPFWTYVDSAANVWGCSMFLGKKEFLYGNLYEQTFRQIWQGEKRRKSLAMTARMDASKCRVNCRMEQINQYLWDLKNPPEHVNFI